MDIGSEIADRCFYVGRESAAVGEVAAETHSCGSYSTCAGWHISEGVDGQLGILVVGGELLGDFVFVAGVGAGYVVGEGFWAGEFMVARGRGDNVAAAG